jgi:uncharacterized protein (DUF1778 family)
MEADGIRIELRISRKQRPLFERAAALQGKSLTDFLVSSAQQAALHTIEETERIRLDAQHSAVFAEALLRPRPPIKRMRLAARRYRKMFEG